MNGESAQTEEIARALFSPPAHTRLRSALTVAEVEDMYRGQRLGQDDQNVLPASERSLELRASPPCDP